jgi:uncharacterized LabA/DUF88 family protein
MSLSPSRDNGWIFRAPQFRHAAAAAGGGSTSEEEVSVEALQSRIEELEEALEKERKQFESEMRKGQEAIDRMQQTGGPSASVSEMPTHEWEDGYDVVTQQRVAVLVDVQNMYYAARNLYNSKLEFSKLLRYLGRGRQLCRALAYIVERPGMEQDKFIEVLRRNGYEVQKKVLVERSDGSQKGDWDIGIAIDAISLVERVDSVVLVTGDGDFTTLCTHLRSRGVRVEVASFPDSTAAELVRSCDHFHRLNEQVLLPGAQFQSHSAEGDEGEPRAPEPRRSRDREEAKEDAPKPARGRRKRARGPLDDDLSEADFGL